MYTHINTHSKSSTTTTTTRGSRSRKVTCEQGADRVPPAVEYLRVVFTEEGQRQQKALCEHMYRCSYLNGTGACMNRSDAICPIEVPLAARRYEYGFHSHSGLLRYLGRPLA